MIRYEYGILGLLAVSTIAHGAVTAWSMALLHGGIICLAAMGLCARIRKDRVTVYQSSLDVLILMMLCFAAISLLYSAYPYATRVQLFRMVNYGLAYFLVLNVIRTSTGLSSFLWIFVIFSSIFATAGLVLLGTDIGPMKVFAPRAGRISATFVNPNHFAGYLELSTWLCIGFAMANSGARQFLLLVLGVYMAAATAFSLSRGGIFGLLAGFLLMSIFFLMTRKRQRNLWIVLGFISAAALVTVWLGIDPVIERFSTLKDPLAAGRTRLEIWKGALKMISDSPWLGHGFGTFMYVYPRYQPLSTSGSFIDYAHNDYLELAAEMGAIGLVCAVAATAILFVSVIRRLRRTLDLRHQVIGIGALAGCFSLLVHAMTDFNFHIPSNIFLFSVCAAIAVMSGWIGKPESMRKARIFRPKPEHRWGFYILTITVSGALLLVNLSPLLGDIYSRQARQYTKNKQYDKAALALDTAVRLDPGNADHLRALGDLAVSKTMYAFSPDTPSLESAAGYYRAAIRRLPINGYYYGKLGNVYQRLGRLKEAEEALKQAIYFAPAYGYHQYDLARLYMQTGNYRPAYEFYREFIQLYSQYLSMVLDEMAAVNPDYEILKQVVPKNAAMRKQFANYLFSRGYTSEAVKELALVVDLEPTVENADKHLAGLQRTGSVREAIDTSQAYLRRFGKHFDLQRRRAFLYEGTGQYQKAMVILEKLITSHAMRFDLYIDIARINWKAGNRGQAIKDLNRGIQRLPGAADLYDYKARYLSAMGQYETALQTLKKLVAIKPRNVVFRYRLGQMYEHYGLYQQAVDQWKACLEMNPEYQPCRSARDRVYKELGIDPS